MEGGETESSGEQGVGGGVKDKVGQGVAQDRQRAWAEVVAVDDDDEGGEEEDDEADGEDQMRGEVVGGPTEGTAGIESGGKRSTKEEVDLEAVVVAAAAADQTWEVS